MPLQQKKQLWEYTVLHHTYEEKDGEEIYKDSKIILGPEKVLAKSETDVMFDLTRKIPPELAKNPQHIEFLIRPF